MAHDVFISYSSQDKTVADAVCATLEGRKIRCWIAPRDVPPGLPYAAALVNAINDCKVFVLILSKGSNTSGAVMREVEEAVDSGTPIIPIRIEEIEPTEAMRYYIKSIHWIDAMSPPLQKHLGKLADSVQAILSVGAEEHPPPVAESVIEAPAKKRWPLPTWATALLALAAVVIVGGGAWLVATRLGSAAVDLEAISTTVDATAITEPTLISTIESSTTTTIEDTESTSKFDWHHNPVTDHYYALTETGMSWDMLEELAVQTGGHLVSINDAAEEEWLYSTFGSIMFWIGLTDYPDEGEYRWTSGEPVTYLKWCPGEPTDTAGGAGSEDAVHAIPWSQCWNDEPTWITEFWDPDKQKNIPSYPGVIEVETAPSHGWSVWRPVSFLIPNPQIWDVTGDNQYTAIEQRDSDVYAWSTESYQGDIMVSLDLRSSVEALDLGWDEMQAQIPSQNSGCVIIYGDGTMHSYGSLVFCVDWDGYFLDEHNRRYDNEFLAYVLHDNPSEEVYSVTVEIIDDIASMYVNGEKVLSSFFNTEEIDRSGRIGLFKYWADGEITFSNIQIKTRNSDK